MKVSELRERLEKLHSQLSGWGAKKADLNDLEKLLRTLEAFDEQTVSALCNQLDALSGSDAVKPAKKSSMNEAKVTEYVDLFANIDRDRIAFQSAYAKLAADKKVRLQELIPIANSFVGSSKRYSKKNDALESIELTFNARLSMDKKLGQTKDIF